MGTKICSKCEIEKELGEFRFNYRGQIYSDKCKSCAEIDRLLREDFKVKCKGMSEDFKGCRICYTVKPISEFPNYQSYKIKGYCKDCGKTREQENRNLAVHHIDYNKKNNSPYNLVTLCSLCHARTTNGDRVYWQAICKELMVGKYLDKEVNNDDL